MGKYTDYLEHVDTALVLYERYTACYIYFCRKCNFDEDKMIDAFIKYCRPRGEWVRYNGEWREVVDYPGMVDYVDAVVSLGGIKILFVDYVACMPQFDDMYNFLTCWIEKEVVKRDIEVIHSDRVLMQRASLQFRRVTGE